VPVQSVDKGPSIKCVTLFLANFEPPPLSHFVTHFGTPKKYFTHLGPPIFSRSSTKNPDKNPLKFSLNFSRAFFFGGFVRGSLGFVQGDFCPFPFCVRIHLLQQKVKHHFKFQVSYIYIKNIISVTSQALYPSPLSQTVTTSRTPSSLHGRPLKEEGDANHL